MVIVVSEVHIYSVGIFEYLIWSPDPFIVLLYLIAFSGTILLFALKLYTASSDHISQNFSSF